MAKLLLFRTMHSRVTSPQTAEVGTLLVKPLGRPARYILLICAHKILMVTVKQMDLNSAMSAACGARIAETVS